MMQRQGVELLEVDTSTKINNNFFSFLSDKGLKDTIVLRQFIYLLAKISKISLKTQ